MPRSLAAIFLAFAFSASAQTVNPTVQQVQLLAPQLVAFAGSSDNFQSLVQGLTQGSPVTLTTSGQDGFVQIATFQPAGTLSALEAARTLETARQNLISRGVATPNAQQLAAALAGGTLPTAAGAAPIAGVLAEVSAPIQLRTELARLPALPPASASTGASAPLTSLPAAQGALAPFLPAGMSAFEANQAIQLATIMLAQQGILSPTTDQLRAALLGGTVRNSAGSDVRLQGVLQGGVRQTTAAPPAGNLSNSPFFGTSDSPAPMTSTSPFFGTSNSPLPGSAPPNTIGTVTITPPANLNTVIPDRPR